MAISSQQNVNQVQIFYPVQPVIDLTKAQVTSPGNTITDAGSLCRAALDGDREAQAKLGAGEGGPDFVCSALTTAAAADNATFLIPIASLLKLYAGPLLNAFLAIKVKVSIVGDTAVANSSYAEAVLAVQDLVGAGNYTAVQAQANPVAGTVAPVLTVSGSTNLSIATGATVGAVVHRVRVEVFVNHIQ